MRWDYLPWGDLLQERCGRLVPSSAQGAMSRGGLAGGGTLPAPCPPVSSKAVSPHSLPETQIQHPYNLGVIHRYMKTSKTNVGCRMTLGRNCFYQEGIGLRKAARKVPSSQKGCRKDPRKCTHFTNRVWLLPNTTHHGSSCSTSVPQAPATSLFRSRHRRQFRRTKCDNF